MSGWLIGARSESVTQDDRLAVVCVWNGLVVFVSVFFLTGAFFKSALIATFVLISSLLGFGERWLLRGGFAISVLAIGVMVGAIPHPDHWKDVFQDVRAFLEYRNNVVSSTAAAPDLAPFRPVASSDQATDLDGSRRQ
jgi:hypothetical protein